jgi:hypothetical protein
MRELLAWIGIFLVVGHKARHLSGSHRRRGKLHF